MDEIRDIVDSIIYGCSQGGVEVSEVLAAFVARTVVEENASSFSLDRRATDAQKQEVILQSITKLLEQDNPSLEMIKMQVDFDSTYLKEENEAERKLKARSKLISTHKTAITDVEMEDANDYEALTTLYRKIFRFLLEFAPNTKTIDRSVEREIAAALESVFPRVGLKAFIQLSYEEKITQLMELARIILGIRLFNRDEGRGGAGIDDMDKDSNILANVLAQDIDREVEFFTDACSKYQRAVIKAHIAKRKKLHDEYQAEYERNNPRDDDEVHPADDAHPAERSPKRPAEGTAVNPLQVREVDEYMMERWSQEMANRRQYLGFLKTLQDEAKFLLEKISSICANIRQELLNVRALVSNKNAVPKEVVYPRFDAIGSLWLQLFEEVLTMIARSNTFQELCKYRLSFTPTLTERFYLDAVGTNMSLAAAIHDGKATSGVSPKKKEQLAVDATVAATHDTSTATANASEVHSAASVGDEKSVGSNDVGDESQVADESTLAAKELQQSQEGDPANGIASEPADESVVKKDSSAGGAELGDGSSAEEPATSPTPAEDNRAKYDESTSSAPTLAPAGSTEEDNRIYDDIREIQGASDSGPQLLSVVNTPDFMLLPLELQGYCPWTIVEARGLLIPGKPALGIVRYDNHYYVFDHPLCIKAFMMNPHKYLSAIKDRALRNPEFINLLHLQKWFPTASIAKLLKQHELETSNKSGQPLTKDASTGTPTHFIDSYIDINYHWNEWELRRRALKIVNLKKCSTTAQQTDESHFRRDTETQIYPHRIKGTQTKREKGTNPPTVTTYVAGLRGKQTMAEQKRVVAAAVAAGLAPPSDVDQPWELEYPAAGVVALTLDDTLSAADNIKLDYYNPKV